MPFDLSRLVTHSVIAIRAFAKMHAAEHFYAFAIDANLLCLNSIERFEETLKRYQNREDRGRQPLSHWSEITSDDLKEFSYDLKRGKVDVANIEACKQFAFDLHQKQYAWKSKRSSEYRTPEVVAALRSNTGDWAYQGFAELPESQGFDARAYDEHYYLDSDPDAQKCSEYAVAMDQLIELLKSSAAFDCLTLSEDFYATRVEHNY
jgi:hypothetical protein